MKIYRSNSIKVAWYKRINWIKLIISIIIVFLAFTFGFNYLAKNTDLDRAIKTSLIISLLFGINIILNDLFSNKNIIFMYNKDSIHYIDLQNEASGKFISDLDYRDIVNEHDPEDIYNHINKYVGIVRGEIIEINSLRETMNSLVLKVKVKEKKWKQIGLFFVKDVKLIEKEYNKKIVVKKDIEKYEDIKKMLLKKK